MAWKNPKHPDFNQPLPPCPKCKSVNVRLLSMAEPRPGLVTLRCDDCFEVWAIKKPGSGGGA
jgi:hypothetical protein